MNDNLEEIGQAADTLDNLTAALIMPLSPELHLKVLREALPEVALRIKEAVIAESGENPWEE